MKPEVRAWLRIWKHKGAVMKSCRRQALSFAFLASAIAVAVAIAFVWCQRKGSVRTECKCMGQIAKYQGYGGKSRSDAMSVLRGASPDAAEGNKKALEELKEAEANCKRLEAEEQRLRAEIEKQLIEFHVGVQHVKKRAEAAK